MAIRDWFLEQERFDETVHIPRTGDRAQHLRRTASGNQLHG